jgi:hypothetical protein
MSRVALNVILDHLFRSNPNYELAPFDRLPSEQQVLLKDLTNDPDFFGILVSRTPGTQAIKSVGRDTALLLQSLVQPGALPSSVRASSDDETNQAIAQLVLDGVLEISQGEKFVSGAEAYPIIYPNTVNAEPLGVLPRLSLDALKYGQALEMDDPLSLSMRLYFYNRVPMTPEWSRRLPSENHVTDFLGISGSGKLKHAFKHWTFVEGDSPYKAWFHWYSRRGRPPSAVRQIGYKLYVSPHPDAMPAAMRAVVESLDDRAAYAFKVARNAVELLRPDKLVIYFWDFDGLQRAAEKIAAALSSCAVHGVPFTAALDDSGLLSWGIDPAPEKDALAWQGRESWRSWITNRLASALVSARNRCPADLQPWQFALERLRLANIDVDTWSPGPGFDLPAV